jgi:hypothetical protein
MQQQTKRFGSDLFVALGLAAVLILALLTMVVASHLHHGCNVAIHDCASD